MTGGLVSVRPAVRDDVAELAPVLARAFQEDPVFAWLFPSTEGRARRMVRFFRHALVYEALYFNAVEVACMGPRIVGGTAWYPPGHPLPPVSRQLLALPGNVMAFGRRLGAAQAYTKACMDVHPRPPHWYLNFVGVEPELQGQGIGATLIGEHLQRCDRHGLPAYLESSTPRNRRLYQHLGFQPTGVPPLPPGAPAVTAMWRPPAGAP